MSSSEMLQVVISLAKVCGGQCCVEWSISGGRQEASVQPLSVTGAAGEEGRRGSVVVLWNSGLVGSQQPRKSCDCVTGKI